MGRTLRIAAGVVIAALLLAAGCAYHTRDARDPRAAPIRQYLAGQFSAEPWYPHITGIAIHDDKVYVHTDLPAWGDTTKPLDPATRRLTLGMYNPLWDYIEFQHRELKLHYVYILDQHGGYLDGGAA